MSPRLLVLTLAAMLGTGCGSAGPVARGTPPPAPPSDLPAPAGVTVEEPVAQSTLVTEPAAEGTPASFSTTQPTAPVGEAFAVASAASEASLSTPPSPSRPAGTAAELFDAQLIALVRNEPPVDVATEVAEDDRALLRSVVDSLTRFRMTLRSGNALRQAKVAPLLDLSERVRSEIPLSLPTLALCRSVTQFGVYDPIDPPRFTAGRETPIVIYCEVDHFRSVPTPDQRFETKLTYEAVLYNDGQASVAVVNKRPQQIVDRCRNRRRDFFLADRMTVPANLPVGKYVLKVTVVDQLANLVAEKTVPVLVAPN